MTNGNRVRRISRLAARFDRSQAVRLTMLLVVSLAATAGFLVSAFLLWVGVWHMPTRYTAACGIGYALFIALMNRWLGATAARSSRNDLMDGAIDAADLSVSILRVPGLASGGGEPPGGIFEGGRSGGGGATASFGVQPPPPVVVASPARDGGASWWPGLDDDGLKLLPLFAVVAIVVGLAAALGVVWSAPHLLAEILVDGAIAGGAYRRLRVSGWTGGIIRRTWRPMAAIVATFLLLGFAGHYFKPGADSIGDLLR